MRITTDDGWTIHIEIDKSADIGRELSRLAFVDSNDPVAPIPARS